MPVGIGLHHGQYLDIRTEPFLYQGGIVPHGTAIDLGPTTIVILRHFLARSTVIWGSRR